MFNSMGQLDPRSLQPLYGISERGTVAFPEDIGPDFNNVVRSQSNKELVKRGVMKIA